MKRSLLIIVCSLFSLFLAEAQTITWTEQTANYSFPSGVKLFKGTRVSPALSVWYIDADLNNAGITVRPYITSVSANVATLTSQFGAIASVNGGVFSGTQSLSTVVYPLQVKAQNVGAVTRNTLSYPVMRSMFGVDKNKNMAVRWVYHYGGEVKDIYTFPSPMPYTYNDPSPRSAPIASDGMVWSSIISGLGGTPTLVKNGAKMITLNEEIVWGSGIAENTTAADPRTAVGYTAAKHCILLAADGRSVNGSAGLSLNELAQVMIDLGCVEAMNLDGGGSTQMAVGNQTVNGQSARAVPTILSVVYADSVKVPQVPTFEKVIDSGDPECSIIGTGWFESSNAGYYGTTKSKLNPVGTGSNYAVFTMNLPKQGEYEVFGWWVADAGNRCKTTPFIISRQGGMDTVKVDQSVNGSQWRSIGKFTFTGTAADSVIISNLSSESGKYIVVDAIRVISYDPSILRVHPHEVQPAGMILHQNFPNPFNPSTTISFSLRTSEHISLDLYNVLGERIMSIAEGKYPSGEQSVILDAKGIPSGVYFCRLQTAFNQQTIKVILQK